MSTEGKRGPGRPSKGPRAKRTFRYPFSLDDALEQAAADEGMADVQDLMIKILSDHLIERGYLPKPDDDHQESERPLMIAS